MVDHGNIIYCTLWSFFFLNVTIVLFVLTQSDFFRRFFLKYFAVSKLNNELKIYERSTLNSIFNNYFK